MAVKLKITKKDNFFKGKIIHELVEDFIHDSYTGKRTKKNGQRISKGTIRNYEFFQKQLIEFCNHNSFELRIYIVNNLTSNQKERAKRYNRKFYLAFTEFMFEHQKMFNNYVGLIIKCLKCFYSYLEAERNISVGNFHKLFYVPYEEIPIIALSQDQLRIIIFDEAFEERLKQLDLEKIRDIFVFGCSVALRISDLLDLTRKNLIIANGIYYLQVKSQKTNTFTKIKLPQYCIEILLKYQNKSTKLLPEISTPWFNKKLKEMGALLPDNFEMPKIRERNGKQVVIYKDKKKKVHYKLSDHISTHTMRRTGITTMLCLGMPEHIVRKISGHAPNSKEFYRYVLLSQSFIDDETDRMFEKLTNFN